MGVKINSPEFAMETEGNNRDNGTLFVNVSVANVYSGPAFTSEVVTQALLGEKVVPLEGDDRWVRIKQWDGYEGWIRRFFLTDGTGRFSGGLNSGESFVVDDLFAQVHENSNPSSPVIRDLVYGDELVAVDKKQGQKTHKTSGEWTRVLLPDGKGGWTASGEAPGVLHDPRSYISGLARRFLGVQYFWGGKSPKGFDCSGFVQTVMKRIVPLPRDSRDQAVAESLDDIDPRDVREGDLLFFSQDYDEVDHVAISLGTDRFIHSSGFVKIESLNENSPDYNAHLHGHLDRARSIERVIS